MRQKVVAINPNGPSLKSVTNLDRSIQILGMHTGSKSIKCIVSLFKDIFNIFKLPNSNNRSENFFLHYLHSFVDACENRRLNEISLFAVTFTAEYDFGTFILAGFDVVHNTCELKFRDLWTLDSLGCEWIADDIFLCTGSEFLNEFVVNVLLDINTRSSAAALT